VVTFLSRRLLLRARIVKIGNSKGVRLPKPLLEQTGIKGDVELEVGENQIVIRAISHPREGWDSAFKAMHKAGDDTTIDESDVISDSWDEEEWQW
jgi:antitoxin MazE